MQYNLIHWNIYVKQVLEDEVITLLFIKQTEKQSCGMNDAIAGGDGNQLHWSIFTLYKVGLLSKSSYSTIYK